MPNLSSSDLNKEQISSTVSGKNQVTSPNIVEYEWEHISQARTVDTLTFVSERASARARPSPIRFYAESSRQRSSVRCAHAEGLSEGEGGSVTCSARSSIYDGAGAVFDKRYARLLDAALLACYLLACFLGMLKARPAVPLTHFCCGRGEKKT